MTTIERLDGSSLGTRIITKKDGLKLTDYVLKKCPYCGEKLNFYRIGVIDRYRYAIQCGLGCSAITKYYKTPLNAVLYGKLENPTV